MNTLFICNTPYQILVAFLIASKTHENDICRAIISDHAKSAYKIYRRIKEQSDCFDDVFYVETRKWQNEACSWAKRVERHRDESISLAEKLNILDYDRIIYSSRDVFTINALNYVLEKNEDVVIEVMEDGFSTYSFDKKGYDSNVGLEAKVSKFHLFHPDKMSWQPNAKLESIDIELCNDDAFKREINRVFGYHESKDDYSKKIIFFESGFQGWENKKSLELLETIGQHVGKDNILIKMHPRNNGDERVKALGYDINANYEVPWEIIALNIDISNKILITDFSSCVATANCLFGKEYRAIVLCDMLKEEERDNEFVDYLKEYIYIDSNVYCIPQNVDELICGLDNQFDD